MTSTGLAVKDFLAFFGRAFSALLPLINPLGSALVLSQPP
jgi:hypothetical protein